MEKEYLIQKWLNNDLTDSENEAFVQGEDYQLNIDILEYAESFKASHFSKIDDFNAFKKSYNSQNKPVKKLHWVTPMLRIASVVVIAFGMYFTFFYNNLTQIQTLANQKTTIELPDLSQVTLNALSSIEYNAQGWNDNRSLKLEGEAYFEVAKGKKFDVLTTDGIVTVVGTKFNVKQRNNYFEVKCFEGIVRVTSDSITRQLVAGDTYQILNGTFIQETTISQVPQWTKNISSFKSIPFKEVIAELERQYNIKVIFKNINTNRIFTGGFIHDNLENALISITQPMDLTYELNSSNLIVIYAKKN